MTDYRAVTQDDWNEATARIAALESALEAALPVIESHVPPQSTSGNMLSLRDRVLAALGRTTPETSRTDEGYDANGSPVADTVPPGHFWRGVPESNRHQCRNCGHHYDEHHHTDESSRCPL